MEYALAQAESGHGQQFVRVKVLAVLAVLIKRTWYASTLLSIRSPFLELLADISLPVQHRTVQYGTAQHNTEEQLLFMDSAAFTLVVPERQHCLRCLSDKAVCWHINLYHQQC